MDVVNQLRALAPSINAAADVRTSPNLTVEDAVHLMNTVLGKDVTRNPWLTPSMVEACYQAVSMEAPGYVVRKAELLSHPACPPSLLAEFFARKKSWDHSPWYTSVCEALADRPEMWCWFDELIQVDAQLALTIISNPASTVYDWVRILRQHPHNTRIAEKIANELWNRDRSEDGRGIVEFIESSEFLFELLAQLYQLKDSRNDGVHPAWAKMILTVTSLPGLLPVEFLLGCGSQNWDAGNREVVESTFKYQADRISLWLSNHHPALVGMPMEWVQLALGDIYQVSRL